MYGRGSGPIWATHVSCTGTEAHIGECMHKTWDTQQCDAVHHTRDAGCQCQRPGGDTEEGGEGSTVALPSDATSPPNTGAGGSGTNTGTGGSGTNTGADGIGSNTGTSGSGTSTGTGGNEHSETGGIGSGGSRPSGGHMVGDLTAGHHHHGGIFGEHTVPKQPSGPTGGKCYPSSIF